MSTNRQRGDDFSESVGHYLNRGGIAVHREYEVEVSINSLLKKPHKFDWGNDTILVECKTYTRTKSGKNPSAKLSTANEALLYFMAAPKSYRKMLFMSETERFGRLKETLAENYVRRYGHFIPNDVEVHEFDKHNLSARRIWPHPSI